MKFRLEAAAVTAAVISIGVLSPPVYAAASDKPSASASSGSSVPPGQAKHAFVAPLNQTKVITSTRPDNQDQNPYGVAVVPRTQGTLTQGNVLVSNFNDVNNSQGLGSTIVQITPGGTQTLFAQITTSNLPPNQVCPGGIGLTTALVALQSGFVIVGSLPTTDGSAATTGPGCLLVLNSSGTVVETISGSGINGPWDMTALDNGAEVKLFVTNVLNGTVAGNGAVVNGGTILRLDLSIAPNTVPHVDAITTIGSGFGERTDPVALVVGPTGVGLSHNGTLFVADTVGNRITAINNAVRRHSSAGTGRVISADNNLSGPLGMSIAPNGNILTVNGGDGNLVETRPSGKQIAVRTLDNSPAPPNPPGFGALFGVAANAGGPNVYYVDDNTNTLNLLF